MLFNSIEFAIFLPIVFLCYHFIFSNNLRAQNVLILLASYVFYGWWDWRFLSLILISSSTDFFIGRQLYQCPHEKGRKYLLLLSLTINLGLLGFFKYFNFFIDSFVHLGSAFSIPLNKSSLNIILPVGISFYTFQTLSYSIDIYHRKIKPTDDAVAFFTFVGFFPQLFAGPIERARNLLPQFLSERRFSYENATDGLKQILFGFFKKVVIADTCAKHADAIFANYASLDGSLLLLGAIYFAFQIYGDFSGYSDMAIGISKLFGFQLMTNFSFPYFSRDIAEFWRRWHISLSSWFRDYVFIPLGGSRCSKLKRIRNILVTFSLSGLWHGANWTFIFWGLINGLYYLPLMLKKNHKKHTHIVAENTLLPTLPDAFKILATFTMVLIGWVFFRSETLTDAFHYLNVLISPSLFTIPKDHSDHLWLIVLLIGIEWFQRRNTHGLQMNRLPAIARWGVYYTFIFMIFCYFNEERTFVYFQF